MRTKSTKTPYAARTPAVWKRLRKASAAIGRDAGLVQGAGGNVSLKCDGVLWIKASGKWLSDAEREEIFVAVALDGARGRAIAGGEDFAACLMSDSGLRPSIETSMHAWLPHRVVLHVHSVNVLCHAVIEDGAQALARPLAAMRWRWVPYARPGAPLTRMIASVTEADSHDPLVLVLANHGLVVAADDLDQAMAMVALVERALQRMPRPQQQPVFDAGSQNELARRMGGALPKDSSIHVLATDPAALEVARLGPLYPDHVVFLGPVTVTRDVGETQGDPWSDNLAPYVVVPRVGVIVRRDISANAEAMLGCWAALAARISTSERIVPLSEAAIRDLLGWDAEKYRQSLARSMVSRPPQP